MVITYSLLLVTVGVVVMVVAIVVMGVVVVVAVVLAGWRWGWCFCGGRRGGGVVCGGGPCGGGRCGGRGCGRGRGDVIKYLYGILILHICTLCVHSGMLGKIKIINKLVCDRCEYWAACQGEPSRPARGGAFRGAMRTS